MDNNDQFLCFFKFHTTKTHLFNVIHHFTEQYANDNDLPFSVEEMIDKRRNYFNLKRGVFYKYGHIVPSIPGYIARVNVLPISNDTISGEIRSFKWDPAETSKQIHQNEINYLIALSNYLDNLYGGVKIIIDPQNKVGGRPILDHDEKIYRLAKAQEAEEIKYKCPDKQWKEIAMEVGWKLGTNKSAIKKLEYAREELKDLEKSDPDNLLLEVRNFRREEKKKT